MDLRERVVAAYDAREGTRSKVGDTLARLPTAVRVALVRADSDFCTRGVIAELEARGLHYIMTAASRRSAAQRKRSSAVIRRSLGPCPS